ncbi:hypothetical protein GIB67_034563 [Kingdonia uniflora]|uniref:Uncharacterized protein n=1 Tax=Kingdonia uniflora TaxID=39325 RepID=A0A7J7MXD0_9MAGN|nr:hypothetical protein GIB67_034563 [Kingdonia uniflora]
MLDIVSSILFPQKLILDFAACFALYFFWTSDRKSPQEYSGASTSIESFGIMIFGVLDVGVSGFVLVELPGLSLKFDFLATLRLDGRCDEFVTILGKFPKLCTLRQVQIVCVVVKKIYRMPYVPRNQVRKFFRL